MSENTQNTSMPPNAPALWRRALSHWGLGVDLSPPLALPQGKELAFIDLRNRQTWINMTMVDQLGLADQLEALMAHEAGHHCRYPQTLVCSAKLVLRCRSMLLELECHRPGNERIGESFEASRFDYLQNFFLDVLINHSLKEEHAQDFATIYRTLLNAPDTIPSAVFSFVLAVYEELWSLPQAILSDRERSLLQGVSASWSAQARELAADIDSHMANVYQAFDLFLEAVWLYLVDDARRQTATNSGNLEDLLVNLSDLEPDELSQVTRISPAEKEADQAREDQLNPVLVELPPDPDAPDREEEKNQVGSDLSTMLQAGREFGSRPDQVSDLVYWYYERLAERLRIELDSRPGKAPLTPTTLDTWQADSDPSAIDWSASLGRSGVVVPGLTLLEREYEEDDLGKTEVHVPWLEIWVDSSSSMPVPSQAFSPVAFAGFVLSRAALKAGSRVRLIQYAARGKALAMEDFSADEALVQRTLLQHLSGGTNFPFELLDESLERFRSAARFERIVLSDFDFFHNVKNAQDKKKVLDTLSRAAREPNSFTAILNIYGMNDQGFEKRIPEGLQATGVKLLPIREWNELHGLATILGRKIFGL